MKPGLRHVIVLAACLLLPSTLAGCNVKQWYNDVGTVEIYVTSAPVDLPYQPDAGANAIENFSSFYFGVTTAAVHPVNEIENTPTIKLQPPVAIDLVTRYHQGKGLLVYRASFSTKAIESVDINLVFADAKDRHNTTVPACERPIPKTHPCIEIEPSGHYIFDKTANPVDMQRGKTMVITMPLAIRYRTNEPSCGGGPCYQLTSRTQEGSVTFTSCILCFS